MAGQFGHEIQAQMIVLTHFSQRYKNVSEHNSHDSSSLKLVQQAKEVFENDVLAAEDLTVVSINMTN